MLLETEDLLIQAALAQDPAAWKKLLTQYGGKMYGIALRFLANEEEAKDIIQEVWLLISRKLCDFRGDSKLSTWIYRITVNKCLEKIRLDKQTNTESIEALLPDYVEDGHYKKEFPDW